VADAVGISRSHVTKIENDGDHPGRATLLALATYFGVSMDYLETGAQAPDAQLVNNLPDGVDERAWMLLGKQLSEPDKLAVTEFVRSTILRKPTTGHRRKR
jgi:transcriptional regulator with XRE-family HTH domain